jgi:hypothetical protein
MNKTTKKSEVDSTYSFLKYGADLEKGHALMSRMRKTAEKNGCQEYRYDEDAGCVVYTPLEVFYSKQYMNSRFKRVGWKTLAHYERAVAEEQRIRDLENPSLSLSRFLKRRNK